MEDERMNVYAWPGMGEIKAAGRPASQPDAGAGAGAGYVFRWRVCQRWMRSLVRKATLEIIVELTSRVVALEA